MHAFFTFIKPAAGVLACVNPIACIKWRRLLCQNQSEITSSWMNRKYAVSLANDIRAVEDKFCTRRTCQPNGTIERWFLQKRGLLEGPHFGGVRLSVVQ